MLYEILIPTTKPDSMPGKNRFFTTRYHRLWDAKVIKISKGLTVLRAARGVWVSPDGIVFKERMIPVRVSCNKDQIEIIMDLAAAHYQQQAIMAYKISSEVIIKHYGYIMAKLSPFPWICSTCGKNEVRRATIKHTAIVKRHSRKHVIEIPDLPVLQCKACGAILMENDSHDRIFHELRQQKSKE